MPEFSVEVRYEGTLEFTVEADDEKGAAKAGLAKFKDASLEDIAEGVEADDIAVDTENKFLGYFSADLLEEEMRRG